MSDSRAGSPGPRPALLVADPPDGGGDLFRLLDPDIDDAVVVHRPTEEDHRRHPLGSTERLGPLGDQRLVGGLRPFGAGSEEVAENGVRPGDDPGNRSEVGGEGHPVGEAVLPHVQEEPDVGAPESVDGLFGVPHEEQPTRLDRQLAPCHRPRAGFGAPIGDPEGHLRLDRVGVLEFVDQQPLELMVEGDPDPGVVPDQVDRPDQQVVKLRAFPPAGGRWRWRR